jgi:hypothetical protein
MWNIIRDAKGVLALAPVEQEIPAGHTLEAITANPEYLLQLPAPSRIVTKLEFRRRLTLTERITADSAVDNPAYPAEARAALKTMQIDLQLANEIDLDDADVVAGLNLLVTLGILTTERVAEIRA